MKHVPIEDSFDLHSFHPKDIAPVLDDYLREAKDKGLREVRVIHGKGKGIRRAEVRKLLSTRSDVSEFFDAPPERGGIGATIVLLNLRP